MNVWGDMTNRDLSYDAAVSPLTDEDVEEDDEDAAPRSAPSQPSKFSIDSILGRDCASPPPQRVDDAAPFVRPTPLPATQLFAAAAPSGGGAAPGPASFLEYSSACTSAAAAASLTSLLYGGWLAGKTPGHLFGLQGESREQATSFTQWKQILCARTSITFNYLTSQLTRKSTKKIVIISFQANL